MSAGRYDITIEQGTTWTFNLTWKDGTGSPVDLTNYTARMQIRSSYESPVALVELLSTGGLPRITITPLTGALALLIDEATTRTLPSGHAVYDLEMVAPNGHVTRLLEGSVSVSPEVTR